MAIELGLIPTSKFHSKLQQTFRVLFVNNQAPQDDTLLEKFSSLLELRLLKETGDSDSIADAINTVPWLTTLFENWKSLDSSVVSFGLNVISILSQRHQLKCEIKALTKFIKGLMDQFDQLNALLRCSILRTLHKLNIANVTSTLPSGIFDLALRTLKDGSIFVTRAAKDVLMHLLYNSLTSSNSKLLSATIKDAQIDSSSSCIIKITDYLIHCCKPNEHNVKTKGQANMIINLFIELCINSPAIIPRLKSTSHLHFIILELAETVDDENICSSCCNLLFLLAQWNFQNGLSAEWVTVTDILLRKQQYICLVTFAIFTIERLSADRIQIPKELKAVVLTPLIMSSRWQPCEELLWKESFPAWSSSLNTLQSDSKTPLFSKLNCCIVSNLNKTIGCFDSNTERFHLVNLLMHVLMDYSKHAFFPTKLQNATIDALLGVLAIWGNEWFQSLTASNCSKLFYDSIGILENYTSPISLMIKTMKMAQVIFRSCQKSLLSDWGSIERKLNSIIEKCCHDLQWEIRDSAFEMLAEMAKLSKEYIPLQNWLKDSGLLSLTIVALDDTEGYVRASALHVLENIPDIICKNQMIFGYKEDNVTEPTNTLIRILLQDSEGITRRAAVTTLFSWYQNSYVRKNMVDAFYKSMVIASLDLDWEVKLNAIKFWNFLITEICSKGNIENTGSQENLTLASLEFLKRAGFCDAAISLAKDEDAVVQQKIGKTLKSLKCMLQTGFKTATAFTSDGSDVMKKSDGVPCESRIDEMMSHTLSSENDKLINIEHVLNTRDSTYVEGIMIPSNTHHCGQNSTQTELHELLLQHHHNRSEVTLTEFINWLENFDVDDLLQKNNATTDLYSANPESLLDDILLDNYESDNEEGNAMDCY